MSVRLPNGAVISMAASYGAVKAMSALSNANPAVGTLEASHGVIVSDVLEVTSGWSALNQRIARASVVATNDVTLEGINSSSTARYPVGSGIGSVREILTWTQISQVLQSTSQGGEQQFLTYAFLEDGNQKQIPTSKNPQSLKLSIADDISLPHYALLDAADDDRQVRAIRIVLPGGSVLYYNCFVTLNKTPSLTIDQLMALEVTLSFVALQTRYAS